MRATPTLVVNADDFGLSPGVTRGILEAHGGGIVTSTSLMVRSEHAAAAVAAAAAHPALGVGLHLDLSEWTFRDGEWRCVYEVVPPDDADAVAREVASQIGRFVQLAGRPPTHIDSHQHVHREEPARTAVAEAGRRLGVPVRHLSGANYCGAFYGQTRRGDPVPEGITPAALAAIVRALPAGVTEVACHPAAEIDVDTGYGAGRVAELRALCDPAVRAAIGEAGVRLCHFGETSLAA
jgi:predicted glycoside hydrolase/deacetylase ChbG (UPF0249 family)